MEDHFIFCQLLITEFLSFEDWMKIFDISNSLECEMQFGFSGIEKNEAGLYVINCKVAVPSSETFTIWSARLGKYFVILDAQHSQNIVESASEPLPQPSPHAMVSLRQDINHFVEYNRAVIHNIPMWATAHWLIKPLSAANIRDIIYTTQSQDCYIYYEQPFQSVLGGERFRTGNEKWMLHFFLEFNRVALSNLVFAELQHHIGTKHWFFLYKDGSFQINERQLFPLNEKTVDVFYELVKQFSP